MQLAGSYNYGHKYCEEYSSLLPSWYFLVEQGRKEIFFKKCSPSSFSLVAKSLLVTHIGMELGIRISKRVGRCSHWRLGFFGYYFPPPPHLSHARFPDVVVIDGRAFSRVTVNCEKINLCLTQMLYCEDLR